LALVNRRRIASVEAVPERIAVAYFDHLVVLLADGIPPDRASQRWRQPGIRVGFAGGRPIQLDHVDPLDPGQQVEPQ
jgi:hypothetical protein